MQAIEKKFFYDIDKDQLSKEKEDKITKKIIEKYNRFKDKIISNLLAVLEKQSKNNAKPEIIQEIILGINIAIQKYLDEFTLEKGDLEKILSINFNNNSYCLTKDEIHNLDLLLELIKRNKINQRDFEGLPSMIFSRSKNINYFNMPLEIKKIIELLIFNDKIDLEKEDERGNAPVKYLLLNPSILNSVLFLSLKKYNIFSLNKDGNLFFKYLNIPIEFSSSFSDIFIKFLLNNLKDHNIEQSIRILKFFMRFKDYKISESIFENNKLSIINKYKEILEKNGFNIEISAKDLLLFGLSINSQEIINCFKGNFKDEKQKKEFMRLINKTELTIEEMKDILEKPNEFGIIPLEFAKKIHQNQNTINLFEAIVKLDNEEIKKMSIKDKIQSALYDKDLEKIREVLTYENLKYIDLNEFYQFNESVLTPVMIIANLGDGDLIEKILENNYIDIKKKDPIFSFSLIDYLELSGFDEIFIDNVKEKAKKFEELKKRKEEKEKIFEIIKRQKEKKTSKDTSDLPYSFQEKLMFNKSRLNKKSIEI